MINNNNINNNIINEKIVYNFKYILFIILN